MQEHIKKAFLHITCEWLELCAAGIRFSSVEILNPEMSEDDDGVVAAAASHDAAGTSSPVGEVAAETTVGMSSPLLAPASLSRAASAVENGGKHGENDDDEEDAEEEPSKLGGPVRKPVSAFLHYCAEQRPVVKRMMPSASAGDITKAISESWRGMSEEDKRKFVELAAADKDRYERERAQMPKGSIGAGSGGGSKSATCEAHETVIPIGRVKKIAKLDNEVKSVSKEATAVIAKMTELFISRLATETHVASSGKKIIKASDVAHCIHNRPAFAWLRADYPLSEYNQPKAQPKAVKLLRPENNSTINNFFQPANKKQAVEDDDRDDNEFENLPPVHQVFSVQPLSTPTDKAPLPGENEDYDDEYDHDEDI